MVEYNWNALIKRLLKSELVKRGITYEELANRLQAIGAQETKASVESKIYRGTFSAVFLLQCLTVIGCKNFISEIDTVNFEATKPENLNNKSNN